MGLRKGPEQLLLQALYEEYGAAVLAFIRRNIRDQHTAEDILQETMLRAWRRLDDLEMQRATLLPYLVTVARSAIIDWWRRDSRSPRTVADDEKLATAAVGDEVDHLLDEFMIAEAMRRLSPEHRDVIRVLYFDRRTVQEAARLLGVPSGTVKSRSYYAVRAMRVIFEEMGLSR